MTPVEKLKNLIRTFLAEFQMEGPLMARRLKLPLTCGAQKLLVGLTFFSAVEFFWTKFRVQKYLGSSSNSAAFSFNIYML